MLRMPTDERDACLLGGAKPRAKPRRASKPKPQKAAFPSPPSQSADAAGEASFPRTVPCTTNSQGAHPMCADRNSRPAKKPKTGSASAALSPAGSDDHEWDLPLPSPLSMLNSTSS